jgi:hypothetical protein
LDAIVVPSQCSPGEAIIDFQDNSTLLRQSIQSIKHLAGYFTTLLGE